MEAKKKVCIVGGGPSGLAALRRVLESPVLTGTLFEQKEDIGGLWQYESVKKYHTSPKLLAGTSGSCQNPAEVTSMYDGLSCNVPSPVLEFPGFPHTGNKSTYTRREEFHQYLRRFATHFDMWSNIKVNTAVVSIRPETSSMHEIGQPCKWIVETHEHMQDVYSTEVFDAVMISIGKHLYPYEPAISGLEKFNGKVLHSKYFKNAEDFRGQNVVSIGLGASSADIVLLISETAKSVTACHKFPSGFKLGLLPKNAREVKNVREVKENGVITEDNEFIPCDAIILCTGYAVKFPFLEESCDLEVIQQKYVPHLHKMTIFTKRPTLAVLNMCYRAPEVPLAEIQARYFVRYLEGKMKLPSFEEMEAEITAEEDGKRTRGEPINTWHQVGPFGTDCCKYFLNLAEEIGLKEDYRNVPLIEKLYHIILGRVLGSVSLYKLDVFRIVDENTWEHTLATSPEFPESKGGRLRITLNPDFTTSVHSFDI